MDRTRVPHAMWADPLRGERWQMLARLCGSATNEAIDAETRQRLMDSVKEHPILCGTPSDKRFEYVRGARPNGTPARLGAFAHEPHRGRMTPSNIAHAQMGSLVSACSGVVEEQ